MCEKMCTIQCKTHIDDQFLQNYRKNMFQFKSLVAKRVYPRTPGICLFVFDLNINCGTTKTTVNNMLVSDKGFLSCFLVLFL